MHKCLICIGSNFRREVNLHFARRRLVELFPDIRFTPEKETIPLGIKSSELFSNQMALFSSAKEIEMIKNDLKKIERDAGRQREDKVKGIVSLDIDLLIFDQSVLKPEDMQREYIQIGLKELKI